MPPTKETHTPLRNFRCDEARWQEFLEACEEEGTTASQQIRDMIDAWLLTLPL